MSRKRPGGEGLWGYERPDPEPSPVKLDGGRRLAAAVVLQALADLRSRDTLRALDASIWLLGDDVSVFLEAAGLDVDQIQIVQALAGGGRNGEIQFDIRYRCAMGSGGGDEGPQGRDGALPGMHPANISGLRAGTGGPGLVVDRERGGGRG